LQKNEKGGFKMPTQKITNETAAKQLNKNLSKGVHHIAALKADLKKLKIDVDDKEFKEVLEHLLSDPSITPGIEEISEDNVAIFKTILKK